MRIGNKKIEVRAGMLEKIILITPRIMLQANRNKPKWEDWAIEIGWIVWAVGLRVKTI